MSEVLRVVRIVAKHVVAMVDELEQRDTPAAGAVTRDPRSTISGSAERRSTPGFQAGFAATAKAPGGQP